MSCIGIGSALLGLEDDARTRPFPPRHRPRRRFTHQEISRVAPPLEDFTIGVEEEYQIVNPETRELRQRAGRILPRAQKTMGDDVSNELFLSQIEIGTPICRTLADVRGELVRLRRGVIAAAQREGSRIAAAGTHPFSHWEDQ